MAWFNADGTLTASAQAILQALTQPLTPEELSSQTGQPLFKVPSTLRGLATAGLVEEKGKKIALTVKGKKNLTSILNPA